MVDDLQWADASSLRALEFVARALSSVPVLLVATVRPVGPDSAPALVGCLAELARHGLAAHRPPGPGRVRRPRVAGPPHRRPRIDDEVARFVHERTGGNPFFVGEVVELLAQQDRLWDLAATRRRRTPRGRRRRARRVGMLPPATQPLLAVASVLGLTIELDLLAHVTGATIAEVLDALDPAVEAGLLAEDPAGPAGCASPALVADAPRRRAERGAPGPPARRPCPPSRSGLATSTTTWPRWSTTGGRAPPRGWRAGPSNTPRTARLAGRREAHEIAAGYWDDARQLVDLARPGDRQARFDGRLGLGQALRLADDVVPAQQALLDAIAVAEAAGDRAGVHRRGRPRHRQPVADEPLRRGRCRTRRRVGRAVAWPTTPPSVPCSSGP